MREKFNLDDPLIVSYLKYLGNVLTGNFGETFQGLQVRDDILRRLPDHDEAGARRHHLSRSSSGSAPACSRGLRRDGFLDNLVLVSTLLLISLPVFVIGSVLQYLLGIKFRIFPPTVPAGAPGTR